VYMVLHVVVDNNVYVGERKVISVYHFIGFTVAVALCAFLED